MAANSAENFVPKEEKLAELDVSLVESTVSVE